MRKFIEYIYLFVFERRGPQEIDHVAKCHLLESLKTSYKQRGKKKSERSENNDAKLPLEVELLGGQS